MGTENREERSSKMCDKQPRTDEEGEQHSEKREAQGQGGCPCEPKRCLPVVGVVLAAVVVPLMIRQLKRRCRSKCEQPQGASRAGCCA
jgi:hypothetical protein